MLSFQTEYIQIYKESDLHVNEAYYKKIHKCIF